MYVQMKFDFTFNCFCDLVDDFSGNIIGGCREEHAIYDCTPVCNETCRKPKNNYSKYRIRRQKKVADCMTLLWQADNYNMSYKDFVKNWEVL